MKIVYVVSTLKRSGPVNILFSIVKYIDKKKYELYIMSLSPEPVSTTINKFIEMGVKCINLGVPRKNIFKIIKKFKWAVKNINPDIIHSHGLRPDILSAFILKGKYKSCCTIHNYAPVDYKMKFGIFIGYIASWIHLKAIKKISYPVAVSEAVACQLHKHDLKINVIQNGVDTDYFNLPSLEKKASLRKCLSLNANSIIFIYVGSLIQRKNPLFILEKLSKYNIKFSLLFVGNGALKCYLESYSNRFQGDVKFMGNVPNVLDYLQASDYFISASKSEGLPTTVLEAASVGLPLLLSDIPAHREILCKNKSAGVLFKFTQSSLINAITSLKKCDYSLSSINARNLICENFSAEKMSKGYQNLYNKVIIKK